jgi:hypothetical protein
MGFAIGIGCGIYDNPPSDLSVALAGVMNHFGIRWNG